MEHVFSLCNMNVIHENSVLQVTGVIYIRAPGGTFCLMETFAFPTPSRERAKLPKWRGTRVCTATVTEKSNSQVMNFCRNLYWIMLKNSKTRRQRPVKWSSKALVILVKSLTNQIAMRMNLPTPHQWATTITSNCLTVTSSHWASRRQKKSRL